MIISSSFTIGTKHIESEGDLKELEESYRLRYKIYCQEAQFLNKEDYPEGKEFDEYDLHSEHIVAQHVDDANKGAIVGTIRLVNFTDQLGFPTGKHYPELYELIPSIDYHEISEISRLCIAQEFRRRLADKDGLYGIESYLAEQQDERRKYPVILLHLFKKMYIVSKQKGIRYWLASMEDSLFKVLSKYGVRFQIIGENYIEYYGRVRPYIAEMAQLEEMMSVHRPDLWPFFCDVQNVP